MRRANCCLLLSTALSLIVPGHTCFASLLCQDNGSKKVVVVNAAVCPSRHTLILNTSTFQGPPGTQGPSGPQGPAGPTANITQLQATVDALQASVIALTSTVAKQQLLLQYFSINTPPLAAGPTITLTGVNLELVNGTGVTGTYPDISNGLGNLIIGYNEDVLNPPKARYGSHNLVVGSEHSYSSYGGIVAGYHNSISAEFASVTGGKNNSASGPFSSVTGGQQNQATHFHTSVNGGSTNIASQDGASVAGGYGNKATAGVSSVSGGILNTASGVGSTVSGGDTNFAEGVTSTVSGGRIRYAHDTDDWSAGSLSEDN